MCATFVHVQTLIYCHCPMRSCAAYIRVSRRFCYTSFFIVYTAKFTWKCTSRLVARASFVGVFHELLFTRSRSISATLSETYKQRLLTELFLFQRVWHRAVILYEIYFLLNICNYVSRAFLSFWRKWLTHSDHNITIGERFRNKSESDDVKLLISLKKMNRSFRLYVVKYDLGSEV